jgi:hypothetical protein
VTYIKQHKRYIQGTNLLFHLANVKTEAISFLASPEEQKKAKVEYYHDLSALMDKDTLIKAEIEAVTNIPALQVVGLHLMYKSLTRLGYSIPVDTNSINYARKVCLGEGIYPKFLAKGLVQPFLMAEKKMATSPVEGTYQEIITGYMNILSSIPEGEHHGCIKEDFCPIYSAFSGEVSRNIEEPATEPVVNRLPDVEPIVEDETAGNSCIFTDKINTEEPITKEEEPVAIEEPVASLDDIDILSQAMGIKPKKSNVIPFIPPSGIPQWLLDMQDDPVLLPEDLGTPAFDDDREEEDGEAEEYVL